MRQDILEQNALPEDLQMTAVVKPSHAKRTYSKEFLLSVSKLEGCNRAPVDLDAFFRRDTQPKLEEKGVAIPGAASSRGLIRTVRENDVCAESPPDVPEWRRPSSLPGSPFLKSGSRHAEQKISSPRPGPAQTGSNATKAIMGRSGSARWESHSNGDERDRDGNRNFFEWESSSVTESGGRFHNKVLARSCSVISQEHDGLLGSGGPIVQRNILQAHLNDWHRPERVSRIGRTKEQYQSTRIGKASRNHPNKQNLGWEDADSVSHETFGSDDQPNGERSEQERQRRDQFEQMRKELRKKPLNIAQNYNDVWLDEGLQSTENLLPSSPGTPHSTSSKEDVVKSFHKPVAASSTPRLLVPPGFSKPVLAKDNNEAAKHEKSDDMDPPKKTTSDDGAELDSEDHLLSKFNRLEDGNQTFPSSQSPMTSKFARWFPRHGSDIKDSLPNSGPSSIVTKSEDQDLSLDSSSAKPELAGGNDIRLMNKWRSVTSLMPSNNRGSVLPMPLGPSLEDVEKMMTAAADSGSDLASEIDLNQKNDVMLDDHIVSERNPAVVNDTCEHSQTWDSEGAVTKEISGKKNLPVFLKCEDLEQSFLCESVHSGIQKSPEDKDNNVNLMELLQIGSSEKEGKKKEKDWDAVEEPGDLDGNASEHIMSLFQKTKGRALPLEDRVNTISGQVSEHPVEQNDHQEDQYGTSKISLESLFGKNFVNELRLVAEPVSAKQIVDDSRHIEKDDSLQNTVLFNKSHLRRAGLADVGFNEQVEWKHNGHVVREPEGPETMSGHTLQYFQDNLLAEASANNQTSRKATKNLPSPRGFSGNGASFGNFRHRNVSYHPYWAQEQHHEIRPTSEDLSRSLHQKPIQEPHRLHDTSMHGMGMYAPSSLVYRAFPGAGSSHLPEQFEEGSSVFRGTYGMPCSVSAGYHESMQMGFNSSQCFPDPRSSGARIRPVVADRWFPGNQALQGFHPYQPLMTHERKPRPGISGLGIGPGVPNYNLAMPSDSLDLPEISYDQYTLSRARPGYG